MEERRRWIDPLHPHLTVQQQCELLGVPRSTYYYQPRSESAENLRLLRRLDELYLDCPFYGSRRVAVTLEVNRKRIRATRLRILPDRPVVLAVKQAWRAGIVVVLAAGNGGRDNSAGSEPTGAKARRLL